MALRKLQAFTVGRVTATVYRDSEWQEYRVRLTIDGKLHAPADYHCTDKTEAFCAHRSMARETADRIADGRFTV